MKNDMRTPDEYNKYYLEELSKMRERAKHTNVKCPECGEEMLYSDNMTLTSDPPQRHIHCPKCKFSTTIFT